MLTFFRELRGVALMTFCNVRRLEFFFVFFSLVFFLFVWCIVLLFFWSFFFIFVFFDLFGISFDCIQISLRGVGLPSSLTQAFWLRLIFFSCPHQSPQSSLLLRDDDPLYDRLFQIGHQAEK